MEKEYIAHVTGAMKKWPSPGPAAYKISRKFKGKCPAIKMRSRREEKKEVLKAPYYNVKGKFGDVPKVNMHVRTQEKEKWTPPGPSYVPPAFGSDAHKIGISPPAATKVRVRTADGTGTSLGRRRNPDATPGPGPGMYLTRTHEWDADGRRGCSILGHRDFNYDKKHSPGPGAYTPKFDKILPQSPKTNIRPKHGKKDPESTPGYRNLGSTLGGPSYTMKRREEDNINLV